MGWAGASTIWFGAPVDFGGWRNMAAETVRCCQIPPKSPPWWQNKFLNNHNTKYNNLIISIIINNYGPNPGNCYTLPEKVPVRTRCFKILLRDCLTGCSPKHSASRCCAIKLATQLVVIPPSVEMSVAGGSFTLHASPLSPLGSPTSFHCGNG